MLNGTSSAGAMVPECCMNIGILWGPDTRTKLLSDREKSVAATASRLMELENVLVHRMKEFDEVSGMKKVQHGNQTLYQEDWWSRDVI